MPQVINSGLELLDGGQITNKLVSALKSGQSLFTLDDKRCYDLGQIQAKFIIGLAPSHASDSSSRLLAHDWYLPYVSFRRGTTVLNAYNAGSVNYLFISSGFNGTTENILGTGTTLYISYESPSSYTTAPEGYYMNPGDNYYWYVNSSGVVTGSRQYYTPIYLEATYTYRLYNSDPNYSASSAISWCNTNGWTPNNYTIYQNGSDHKWYSSYNVNGGTWGALVTGFYFSEDPNGAAGSTYLMYKFKRISSGVATSGGGYKNPTFSISYSNQIAVAGGTITVTVTSGIAWSPSITSGGAYASITSINPGYENGTFVITIQNNPNQSTRSVGFTVVDSAGLISAKSGTITQAAYVPPPSYTEVPYYGFLDIAYVTYDLAEDKNNCYYSGQSGTIYYNSNNYTYYQDANLTYTALPGYYMITQGMDGYPAFSDSEFLLLNY